MSYWHGVVLSLRTTTWRGYRGHDPVTQEKSDIVLSVHRPTTQIPVCYASHIRPPLQHSSTTRLGNHSTRQPPGTQLAYASASTDRDKLRGV